VCEMLESKIKDDEDMLLKKGRLKWMICKNRKILKKMSMIEINRKGKKNVSEIRK
jgi:hypothetical protein